MKFKDVVKQYNIDSTEFEKYLRSSEEFKSFIIESDWTYNINKIDDKADIGKIVEEFKACIELREEQARKQAHEIAEEEARVRKSEDEKRIALANMLITSGFSFDGYKIVKYSGYISGDDAVSVARGSVGIFSSGVNVRNELMDSLKIIRRNAIAELKEAAYDLGCNAVIGVDFDYLTLDPETANLSGGTTYLPYVFGVTANGNAVIIEKSND